MSPAEVSSWEPTEALKCQRMRRPTYPLEARYVCERASARSRSPTTTRRSTPTSPSCGAGSRPARRTSGATPTSCRSTAAGPRPRTSRRPAGRLHAADPRRPARRAARPRRGLGQERRRQPDALVQGPRRRASRSPRRAELGFETLACASTGNLANAVAAHAAAAGPRVLRLHPGRPRGAEGPRDRRLRHQPGRRPRQLRRRQPPLHRALRRARLGVRQRQPAPVLRRGLQDARLRDRRAARLGAARPRSSRRSPRARCSRRSPRASTSGSSSAWSSGELPAMHGAQAAGCSPVAQAFDGGHDVCRPVKPDTIAKSLAIGNPADGPYALELARSTGGSIEAVTDDEIRDGHPPARRDDRHLHRDRRRRHHRDARQARRARATIGPRRARRARHHRRGPEDARRRARHVRGVRDRRRRSTRSRPRSSRPRRPAASHERHRQDPDAAARRRRRRGRGRGRRARPSARCSTRCSTRHDELRERHRDEDGDAAALRQRLRRRRGHPLRRRRSRRRSPTAPRCRSCPPSPAASAPAADAAGTVTAVADPLRDYREEARPGGTPEPAGEARRARAAARRASSSRSTTRRACTGTCGSSTTACWRRGRSRGSCPDAPGDNRLAVRTEDHPLEYLDFQGDIPAGQYGAGTMRIYDRGTFELLVWEPRKVEVELHGEHLTGRWALFPIGREGEDERHWMIHRMGEPLDPDAEPMPDDARRRCSPAPGDAAGGRRAGPSRSSGTACARSATPSPGACRCARAAGRTSRRGYPELGAPEPRAARAQRDPRRRDRRVRRATSPPRPSFQALQRRMHVRDERRVQRLAAEVPVTYVDLRPAVARRALADAAALRRAARAAARARARAARAGRPRTRTRAGRGRGAARRGAASSGLEGVVAKRLRRAVRARAAQRRVGQGRAGARRAELVIGGWIEGEGGRARADRRAAARRARRGRRAAATAGASAPGFGAPSSTSSPRGCAPLAREDSPFAPGARAGRRRARTGSSRCCSAQVAYTERSAGGLLRQPVWLGLRDDVPRRSTLRDERTTRGQGRTATALVDGREIALTNLDKVLYPGRHHQARGDRVRRGDRARCSSRTCSGRALTLVRCPNGVGGQTFFEKRAPSHRPDWVADGDGAATAARRSSTSLADERATLVWLAQLAALELHPSLALADAPERPTAVVFDLDPGAPATIVECCERRAAAARDARRRRAARVRQDVGLQGPAGLRAAEPARRRRSTHTKAFAKAVAEVLARGPPGARRRAPGEGRCARARCSSTGTRTTRAKTTIGVYSLRARERPTVSAPVTWDEVEAAAAVAVTAARWCSPSREILARVEALGDLFAELLSTAQRLPATG